VENRRECADRFIESREMVEENVFPFNGAASFHNFCAPEKSIGGTFLRNSEFIETSAIATLRKHIECGRSEIRLKKKTAA